MPPHVFKEGLRLNSDGYVELLSTMVKLWLERVAAERPYVRQQDSAPRYTSGKSQKLLSESLSTPPAPTCGLLTHQTAALWTPGCRAQLRKAEPYLLQH